MSKKNAVIRFIIAIAVTAAFFAAGKIVGVNADEKTVKLFGFITLGLIVFSLVLLIASIIAKALYVKSKQISVKNAQEYYLTRRDAALRDLPKTVRKMVLLRRLTWTYAAFLLIVGLLVAFAMGFGETNITRASPTGGGGQEVGASMKL